MWIIKLGGSWQSNPRLNDLLNNLSKFKNVSVTLIAGGGMFAETIRKSQKILNFSDELGHYLALLATENFARVISELNNSFALSENLNKLTSNKNIKIWLPSKQLKDDKSFLKDWESTSDSVAVWLSKKINAEGVIFIKSVEFRKNLELKAKNLQKKGILDKNILKYISKKVSLKIIGPEIINVLTNCRNWSDFINSLNDVIVDQ